MLRLLTTCEGCMHSKICKFKDTPKNFYDKICSDDDYNWITMPECDNIQINISCPMITTDKLVTNAITAEKLSVSNLNAIAAKIGNI